MNAHQRRKDRRAKDREPWVMRPFPSMRFVWDRAMNGGDRTVRIDVPLIRGEIGQVDCRIKFASTDKESTA